MPEYLAPGVYVEEVSFRSKSIEGVSTSTTGFAGMTRYGPVQYAGGPRTSEPRLITSFTEFERVYGGLDSLHVGDKAEDERLCYVAHAARAFFANGGKRLYISRVFTGGTSATWTARWPGFAGEVLVETRAVRSKNVAFTHPTPGFGIQARRAKAGAVVEIIVNPAPGTTLPAGNDPLVAATLAVVDVDAEGKQTFVRGGAPVPPLNANDVIQLVELQVIVTSDEERVDVYNELGADPRQKRYIGKILQKDDPEDENAMVYLAWTPTPAEKAAELMVALRANANPRLIGGHDGLLAQPNGGDGLEGKEADPDHAEVKATGLEALAEIDDIAIVALPDMGTYGDEDLSAAAAGVLIGHAERLRYRI
ncbi:MAG: phage tail sheath family protein, partial [Acidobacteria bacterium]